MTVNNMPAEPAEKWITVPRALLTELEIKIDRLETDKRELIFAVNRAASDRLDDEALMRKALDVLGRIMPRLATHR